jgi:hypothetical protein
VQDGFFRSGFYDKLRSHQGLKGLIELDLSYNMMGLEGIKNVARSLVEVNKYTLRGLKLAGNNSYAYQAEEFAQEIVSLLDYCMDLR